MISLHKLSEYSKKKQKSIKISETRREKKSEIRKMNNFNACISTSLDNKLVKQFLIYIIKLLHYCEQIIKDRVRFTSITSFHVFRNLDTVLTLHVTNFIK